MLSLANNKKQTRFIEMNNYGTIQQKKTYYKNKETKSENGKHINYLEFCFHLRTLCLCPIVECLMEEEEEGKQMDHLPHLHNPPQNPLIHTYRKSNTKTSRNLFHGFFRTKWTHSCSAFLDSIFTYSCTAVFTSTMHKTVSASFS